MKIRCVLALFFTMTLATAQSEYEPSETNPYGLKNPNAPAELDDFKPLIGLCDCDSERINPDGTWAEPVKMTWKYKYIMNGMAIQDETLKAERCSSTPICHSSDPVANTVPGPFGDVTTVFVDGNPLPRAPEWLANIYVNYEIPVETGVITLQTDWNYRSDSNIFLYESTEFVAEARWIGGVRVSYENDDGYELAIVGRNVTDEIVVDGAIDFLNLSAFVNEPSYWGVEAQFEF